MEAAIDFKSLRAKFQEEQQSKKRPSVLEKPRRFPALSVCTTSLPHSAVQDKAPSCPPFSLRDDLKQASAKQPISVPSSVLQPDANGNRVTRHSLKTRHLPLVLPVPSLSSTEPVPSSKLVTSPVKCKKAAMPTPFKPSKFSKSVKDILEAADHHKSDSLTMESRYNHQNGGSSCGSSSCPSPEQLSTPSPTAEDVPHVLSTLEKAKKRFSPKNLLAYARPKSFYCSKEATENHPPPPPLVDYENIQCEAECPSEQAGSRMASSPTFVIPNLPKTNGVNHMARPDLHLNGDVKPALPDTRPPPVKVLPDRFSLGPPPMKPPRPPLVDLSSYSTQMLTCENPTYLAYLNPPPAPHPTDKDLVALENPPLPPPPHFDTHDLPDFTTSVSEPFISTKSNLAALELEAAEFDTQPVNTLLPKLSPEEVTAIALQEQRWDELVHDATMCPAEVSVVNPLIPAVGGVGSQSITVLEAQLLKDQNLETLTNGAHSVLTESFNSELPSEPSLRGDQYESCDNVYEEVESISKLNFSQNSRKRKGPLRNPYAESSGKEETRKSIRHAPQWTSVTSETNGVSSVPWDRVERSSTEHHEEKELKKKEKQRLEKEKKEQKDREKKENEMKKKFKITGHEEPMYHARVLLANKLRKHDLQVKSGDTISIIRTTNCPKGKWLARDAQNKYGYISVMNVELNMKEMLELGKRASQAAGRGTEVDTVSLSSRSSNPNPVLSSSFTDDSEEWTADDETLSPLPENICPNRAFSLPDVFGGYGSSLFAASAGSVEDVPSQAKHEALQKLAIFFQNPREDSSTAVEAVSTNINGPGFACAVQEPVNVEEDQFSFADIELLPPPELYADSL